MPPYHNAPDKVLYQDPVPNVFLPISQLIKVMHCHNTCDDGVQAVPSRAGGGRFLVYSLCGWGGAALLSCAALATDLSTNMSRGLVRPGVGTTTCFLQVYSLHIVA